MSRQIVLVRHGDDAPVDRVVSHVVQAGFDPVTGVVNRPGALPQTLIQGCASASCSEHSAALGRVAENAMV